MSMSEIQEAAEIITSAVSPDANIIFGATLKAELEDELIITVIATGFDSAYFHQAEEEEKKEEIKPTFSDETVSNIDLDIDDNEKHQPMMLNEEEHHHSNFWNQPDEDDESDTPAFLRRRKKQKHSEED